MYVLCTFALVRAPILGTLTSSFLILLGLSLNPGD